MKDKISQIRKALGVGEESDAYWNMAGAIYDIENVGYDEVCGRTLKRVFNQLQKVRDILETE